MVGYYFIFMHLFFALKNSYRTMNIAMWIKCNIKMTKTHTRIPKEDDLNFREKNTELFKSLCEMVIFRSMILLCGDNENENGYEMVECRWNIEHQAKRWETQLNIFIFWQICTKHTNTRRVFFMCSQLFTLIRTHTHLEFNVNKHTIFAYAKAN